MSADATATIGTLFQAYRLFRVGDEREALFKGNTVDYRTQQGRIVFMRGDGLNVYIVNVKPHLQRQGVFSQFLSHVQKHEQRIAVLAVETIAMVTCLARAGFRDHGGDFVWDAPADHPSNTIECDTLSAVEMRIADGHADSSMQEIIPGLFLGPMTCLRDARTVTRHHIQYAVNLSQRCSCTASGHGIHVLDIMVEDEPEVDLLSHLPRIYAFIDAALVAGHNVLVNCIMAVSRSASVIVGYLMRRNQWTFEQSLAFVAAKRPCVQPNPGFRFQLVHQRMPTQNEQAILTAEHYSGEEDQ